uniref:Uncharacterized protein n=1 Tax=Acrobeloides nanus TaxID=290746 RepID=A0A914DL95_9BILA
MTAASRLLALFLVTTLYIFAQAAHIEEVRANVDGSSEKRKHENFVPLVAFKCGYRNKYMNESGDWVDDSSNYAQCLEGKYDILKYCKRVYPGKDITNIVEYSHESQIEKWCKEDGTSCKHIFTVRPYRCIVGEFVTESLQVPSKCHFGHVTGRTSCNDYSHWNLKAESECKQKVEDGKAMKLRSFAILEPCGLDLFRGVEFVCCPPDSEGEHDEKVVDLDKDVDEDEYDDDDEDDEDDSDKKEEEAVDQDPYFKEDPNGNEHERFKDAEERLEKKHRKKVTKVITEWSELFERYNKMKEKDPKGAEEYKREMTARFRKTVAALEEENKEQRKQIETVHDERVQSALNEKKRQATHDYRAALALHVGNTNNKHNVLKTLKAYIRAEEKDRIHMLNRFRHLLRSDPEEATAFEPVLLHRLRYIDLRINGTLAMLRDFPELEKEVRPIAVEFWYEYRKENTPEVNDEELTSLGDEAKNERLIKLYKDTYERSKPATTEKLPPNPPTTTSTTTTKSNKKLVDLKDILSEDSDEDQFESDEDDDDDDDDKTEEKKSEKEVKEKEPPKPVLPSKPEPKRISIDVMKDIVDDVKKIEIEAKKFEQSKTNKEEKKKEEYEDDDDDDDDDSDEDDLKKLDKDIHVAIEPIVSAPVQVHEEIFPAYAKHSALVADGAEPHELHTLTSITGGHTVLVMALVACVGLTMIVIIFVKRWSRHHGFIEVDVTTPEERHVSGMQVNGYENPTYSFFDTKP